MEIYNEEIYDLLAKENKKLQIHESLEKGIYVWGLMEKKVSNAEQVLQLIEAAEANRHFGETNMNVRSSRSHTIFRMVIESKGKDGYLTGDVVRVSELNLVDLAGFEPRILQLALGANPKTSIICTVALDEDHDEETKQTLKFASRAKCITNCAQINEESLAEVLEQKTLSRNPFPKLPNDICNRIFGCLNSSDVLLLRSVRRDWKEFVDSNDFIEAYTRIWERTTGPILLVSLYPLKHTYACKISAGEFGVDEGSLPLGLRRCVGYLSILGECRGLLALRKVEYDDFMYSSTKIGYFVWDFSTDSVTEISLSKIRLGYIDYKGIASAYGFHFDKNSSCYKLIKVWSYSPTPSVIYLDIFTICGYGVTLKSTEVMVTIDMGEEHRWFTELARYGGIFVDGCFHHLIRGSECYILCFNATNLTFEKLINLPKLGSDDNVLGAVSGRLVLVGKVSGGFELWIQNRTRGGVADQWTRWGFSLHIPRVVCFNHGGLIVHQGDNELVIYYEDFVESFGVVEFRIKQAIHHRL